MQRSAYRPDIDGLRAVAVVAVVLFHLGFERLAGGFVGVDVFFVISGFLITRIIAGKAAEGRFSFRDFYLARIRRIIPPLIATVAATFLAAAFILMPDDLQRFGRSAIGALTSTSNIIFYLEAGYWDTQSEFKPLLHTWSLGVEEQFYLVWPVFVVAMVGVFGRKRLPVALLAVSVVTFAGALIYSRYDLAGAFYMFPARIFQFAAGAALGCWVQGRGGQTLQVPGLIRDAIFLAGLALVLVSVVTFDAATRFPGWFALPPTLGAVLMLFAGSFDGGPGKLGELFLSNPVSVWIGRLSYALYLVHWPIVSLYRYQVGLELNPVEQLGLAALMMLAAMALHYGVERRFYRRAGDRENVRTFKPGFAALRILMAGLCVAVVAGHAWIAGGWSWRNGGFVLSAEQIAAGEAGRRARFDEGCRIQRFFSNDPECGRPDATRILFLGNSHEPDAYNFVLGGYGHREDLELVRFGTINQCPGLGLSPGGVWTSDLRRCQRRLDVFNRAEFLNSLDYLVYSARFPFQENKNVLRDMIAWVRRQNPDVRVITMGSYFSTDIPCARIVNRAGRLDACSMPRHIVHFADAPEEGPLYASVMALTDVFIDRVDLLCRERRVSTCLVETPEGIPFSYDEHHLSREFAEMSGRMYAARNPDLFGPPPAAAPGAATAPGGQD